MFIFKNTIIIIITVAQFLHATLIITELLKNPMGLESAIPGGDSHEFVEIYNMGPDTMFLGDIFVSDGNHTDSLIPWNDTIYGYENCIVGCSFLVPHGFGVILDPEYSKAPPSSYHFIESHTTLFTIDATSIVGGLTTSKGIFIYRGTDLFCEKILCTAIDFGQEAQIGENITLTPPTGIAEGVSLVPTSPILSPNLWQANVARVNIGISSFINDKWYIEFRTIKKIGENILCFLVVSSPTKSNKISWQLLSNKKICLEKNLSINNDLPHIFSVLVPCTTHPYQIKLTDGLNEILIDADISELYVPPDVIVISEIFPRGNKYEPEWIELFNRSQLDISLKGWRLCFGEDTCEINLPYKIKVGDYVVLTKSCTDFWNVWSNLIPALELSFWRALSNYRDTVKLLAPGDNYSHDSVCYNADWFDLWIDGSLERVSFDRNGMERSSWTISARPSPGMVNGSSFWHNEKKSRLHIGPVPFTPDNNGKNDSLLISVSTNAGSSVNISIYGFNGLRLKTFHNIRESKVAWDGITDNGTTATVGPFIVVAEFKNGTNIISLRRRGVIWR